MTLNDLNHLVHSTKIDFVFDRSRISITWPIHNTYHCDLASLRIGVHIGVHLLMGWDYGIIR